MSDSSFSSSEISWSSSDSLDNFSGFDKLKPYDFEVNGEDEDVSSSTMQRKEAEKERKRNLDLCLCGKCNAMSTNADSLCCR